MRNAQIRRKTAETDVVMSLELDGQGIVQVDTGCGFLDHMLTLFAVHGRFNLSLSCKGDIQVDYHHTVEDIGISLGMAFKEALGDKKGITRYGDIILPMDEALILCAVDLSGRDYLGFELSIPTDRVGTFDTELVEEFWLGFVRNSGITIHFQQFAGKNSHHIIEGAFKASARALRDAASIDERLNGTIPSSKGVL